MADSHDKNSTPSATSQALTTEEDTEHEKVLEELAELERQFADVELDQRNTSWPAMSRLHY